MKIPAFLNFQRLEGRIVLLFLALLLAVQAASFFIIRSSIARNADAAITSELKTGNRVLHRLLAQEAYKLREASELLAKDYGFRRAVGLSLAEDGSIETIRDALANQGERVGASVVAYFNNDLQLVVATADSAGRFVELLKQSQAASELQQKDRSDIQLTLLDSRAYQVAFVQVRTPAPVGWILMGFELDNNALVDLQQLSDLRAIIVSQDSQGAWRPLISNVDVSAARSLLGQLPAAGGMFPALLAGEQMRGLFVPLLQQGQQQQPMGLVLLRSFDDAVAPYRALQLTLLALTLLGVGVFVLGAILMARRISGPITGLAKVAAHLGRGDYDRPVRRKSADEIGDLAEAFEAMRQGIRSRDTYLSELAFRDRLTDLPNRAGLVERLESLLQSRRQDRSMGSTGNLAPCALLMLGLDRFKHVNDVQGHAFGDQVLRAVAARLQALLNGQAHLLARLGGDEFVLLLEQADEQAAQQMAHAIRQDFETPLCLDEHWVDLSAGIGIALFPQHGDKAVLLLNRAALAMYATKKRQSGSTIYNTQMDVGSQESLSLLSELRRAVEGGELRLYLQPKVDLKTGKVISAEALVRWQHPQRGLVQPMLFIPFAEQSGFIRELTRWVIAESVRAWARLQAQGLALRISVNLSTRDLMDAELANKIGRVLAAHGAHTGSLCLEITESAIMDDPARALDTLNQLHSMGFKLSIDDFGTGYSSLAYLKGLPVDELKIDKSFVMAMETDIGDAKIVRSTIELAHNMGLTVVAEGVETAKAWKLLAELGCDEGQGYFIAKPMPEAQFLAWLQAWEAPELGEDVADTVLAGLS